MDKGQEFTMLDYLRLSIILASCLNGCATSEELAQAERIQVEQKQLSLQRELQTLIVNDSETTIVPLLTFSNKHHKSEVSRQAYEVGPYTIGQLSDSLVSNGVGAGDALRSGMLFGLAPLALGAVCLIVASRTIEGDEATRLSRARAAGEQVEG